MTEDIFTGTSGENPTPSSDDSAALKQYTDDKLSLTRQIRLLERFFLDRGKKDRAGQCHDLMVNLAEDRFTLAVVGQFKRGKSSLMNALIGEEMLPVGVVPLTSAITILRFGPHRRLVVAWTHSGFESEKPLSALSEYVTQEGNPNNAKQVRAAYVEAPSLFLRRGLEFVDTPGIGSAIEANTATTLAFIPNCDAVIFVTGVDAPMTGAELDFLRRLRRDVGKVFCVVNKIDLVSQPQRAQIIEFVTGCIRQYLADDRARVFPVSSRLALPPNAQSAAARENSGIAAFHDALGEFLAREKGMLLLKGIIEKSLTLLRMEAAERSAAQRYAALSTTARRSQTSRIRAHCDAIRNTLHQRAQSLADELHAMVVDGAITDLNDRIRLGVVDLSEGLMRSLRRERWGSAGNFAAVFTRNLRDEAKRELNDWLAERRYAAVSSLSKFSADLRETVRVLVKDIEAENTSVAVYLSRLDELGKDPSELKTPFIETAPWPPPLLGLIRCCPAHLVRHPLCKQLRRSVARYAVELKAEAVQKLEDFLEKETSRVREAVGAIIDGMEEDLMKMVLQSGNDGRPASGLSPAQLKQAVEIESALLPLLESVTGQPPPSPAWTDHMDEEKPDSSSEAFTIEPATAQEISLALRAGGCPVCHHLSKIIFNFLVAWQQFMATDDAAQQEYARELGFCPLHTWQLAAISSSRGLSIGYPRLVERLGGELRSAAALHPDPDVIEQLAVDGRGCRACRLLASAQGDCIRELASLLGCHNETRQAYIASYGVCLRHLSPLVAAIQDVATKRLLLNAAAAHLEMLAEDMQGFSMKRDAKRRGLVRDNEQDALQTALEKIAGLKPLCTPWNFDKAI